MISKIRIKYVLTLLISLILYVTVIYADENSSDYKFSCTYDNFKFDFNGENFSTSEMTSYKLQVDVHEDSIEIFMMDGNNKTQLKSRTKLSDYGIATTHDDPVHGVMFDYYNDPSYFYTSNDMMQCPLIKYSANTVLNMQNLVLRFDEANDITSIERLEFSSTKGPWGGIADKDSENVDEVLFDCKKELGTDDNPYFYVPGSYSISKKKSLVFNYQLSYNIVKYKSGKIEISTNYGGYDSTYVYSDNKTSTFSVDGKYTISFRNFGSLDSCPSTDSVMFCKESKSAAYIFTTDTSLCDKPEEAVNTADKDTAEQAGSKYDISNIGGSISTDGLSCDKLFPEGSELKEFIQSAFTIVKVVSICICIMMGVFDFVMSTSKDKDVLMDAVNKTIKRLIIVIIILLLPTLIDTFGGIFGVSTCGIR